MDEQLDRRWEKIWDVRAIVTKALEDARKEKRIGLSLDAQVRLYLPEKMFTLLSGYADDLKSIFIVSSVKLFSGEDGKEVKAEVLCADGKKCERCWNYDVSVGCHPQHPTLCQRCAQGISAS